MSLDKLAVAGVLKSETQTKPEPKQDSHGIILSDVVPESVNWLWTNYIPLGKITVIDGDPGLGKSTATLDLAARISRGALMPDGNKGIEAAGVVILSAEDGLADTIKPRLEAACADCSKILAITAVPDPETKKDRPPIIPDDLGLIGQSIAYVNAKLLIIDPLMAYLSGNIASHRDQDIRRALHQVANLAEDTGVAVVVVRHLNKTNSGNSLYRGGGSIGIIGAARSGLLVAPDPDDENRRVMASIKSNLCKPPKSLSFHIEDHGGTSRIAWDGISNHTANVLLATTTDQDENNTLQEAMDILADILRDEPVKAQEAIKEALSAGTFSKRTLDTAKKNLGVICRKTGGPGTPWVWELPKVASPKDAYNPANPCNLKESEDRHSSEAMDYQESLDENLKGCKDRTYSNLCNLKDDDNDLTDFSEVEL